MKKICQWLLLPALMLSTLCLGITTYAESKTSQAGITFTGDGSIDVSVILQKKDKETNEVLSNATFELRDEAGKLVKVDQSMTTDEKGEIHLTRLFPGKYTFIETKSPEGYQIDKTPIPFEVSFAQTTVKVTAYNEKSKKLASSDDKKTESQDQNSKKESKNKLPKTGTKNSSVWGALGILILLSAIYGMYRQHKTKESYNPKK